MNLGGTDYVVPPLSLGALFEFQKRIQCLDEMPEPERQALVIEITLRALKRNYPTLTREEVLEMVDVANLWDVFAAVMDVSGLQRKELDQGNLLPPANPGA